MSRQYIGISKSEIEGLLGVFLRSSHESQYFTYNDKLNFVSLQISNTLTALLITSVSFSVITSLQLLSLIHKGLTQMLPNLSETSVRSSILSTVVPLIDELISPLGTAEIITTKDLTAALSMESHEEKLHAMIQKGKEMEAKETAKRRMLEIKRKGEEISSDNGVQASLGSHGIGSGSVGNEGEVIGKVSNKFQPSVVVPRDLQSLNLGELSESDWKQQTGNASSNSSGIKKVGGASLTSKKGLSFAHKK
jgi:hypothetical protein